jgi:hypothetical protein
MNVLKCLEGTEGGLLMQWRSSRKVEKSNGKLKSSLAQKVLAKGHPAMIWMGDKVHCSRTWNSSWWICSRLENMFYSQNKRPWMETYKQSLTVCKDIHLFIF